jgi:transposase
MFIKVTRSGSRQYVQLVEAYRDDAGKARHRTVATLGRLDQMADSLDSVIAGLLKVTGRSPEILVPPAPPAIEFESARALGDTWALTELWQSLGFGELRRVFRKTRHATDIEALIRVMVLNRLCNPDSKLGVLRWLETVAIPGVKTSAITHQQLLRSMDALMDHQTDVDAVIAGLLRPLIDQDLSMVFYDLTTIRAAGQSEEDKDVRRFGMGKEGLIGRQFMLGVVQTSDGLPIHHEVLDGNTAESPTLLPTLQTVLKRFPGIRRVILVADRGLLSLDNMEALSGVTLKSGEPVEFILAVPGRRYGEFAELLKDFHTGPCESAQEEVLGDLKWQDLRLVVAHNPQTARLKTEGRRAKIAELEAQAAAWTSKLDAQDTGVRARGKKLSDSGAKARLYHEVKDAHLAHIVRVDLKSDLFTYTIDEAALKLAEMMDGKLLLVTNTPAGLTPDEVVARYKSLADIERGFRVLKSEIEIGPAYHRLPQRIRAHASICFIALILYRVMRQRLSAAKTGLSPERALEQLRRIQHHTIRLNRADAPVSGISKLNVTQSEVFDALRLKKPTEPQQLTLL